MLFAELRPDDARPALGDGARTLSGAALAAAVAAAERWLQAQLPAGAPVGVLLPNRVEHVVLLLALARAGHPALLFPGTATAAELRAHAAAAGLALLVGLADDQRLPQRDPAWCEGLAACRLQVAATAPARLAPPVLFAQFSSGQESPPKLVARTRAAVEAEIAGVVRALGVDAGDRVLVSTRISHSYALVGGALAALSCGARLILASGPEPAEVLELDRRHAPTLLLAVPPLLAALLRAELHGRFASVRALLSAGAPLAAGVAADFEARTGKRVRQDYGATECGTIAIADPDEAALARCVGRPLPHLRVSVRGTGDAPLPAGEVGEIVVEDADRCWRSGDLGRLDAAGRLHLHGRRSGWVRVGGGELDLADAEARLAALPGLRDVALAAPAGGDGGLRVFAVADDAAPADLLDACRRVLGPALPIAALQCVPAIPRTAAGKILRRALPAEIQDHG